MSEVNYSLSIFHFYIEETLEQFEHKLRTFHKEGITSFVEDFAVTLYDQKKDYIHKFEKDYTQNGDVWRITNNRNDYSYTVKNGAQGKVCITFRGPLLGLWKQYLLPNITYVPHTLVGKYDGMEEFVPINEFMKVRLGKNNGHVSEQDEKSGHMINKVFLNEIKRLPKYKGKAGKRWQEEVPYHVDAQIQRNRRIGKAGTNDNGHKRRK